MYTIGLSNQGLPEIILIGVASETLHGIINELGANWKAGTSPLVGKHTSLAKLCDGSELVMETVPVESDAALVEYMFQRANVEEKLTPPYPFETVQLLWPDTRNKLPTEDGYDAARFPQALLPRASKPPLSFL